MDRKHSSSYWIGEKNGAVPIQLNPARVLIFFLSVCSGGFMAVLGSRRHLIYVKLSVYCVLCSLSGVVVHLLSHWEIRDVSGISSDVKSLFSYHYSYYYYFYSSYQTICLYISSRISQSSVRRPSVGLLCMHSFLKPRTHRCLTDNRSAGRVSETPRFFWLYYFLFHLLVTTGSLRLIIAYHHRRPFFLTLLSL